MCGFKFYVPRVSLPRSPRSVTFQPRPVWHSRSAWTFLGKERSPPATEATLCMFEQFC